MKLLGVMVVVVGIVVVAGLALDWWSFSKTDTPTGSNVSLDVNEDRVRQDAANAKREIKDLATFDKRLDGRLTAIDVVLRTITVAPTSGPEVTLITNEDTEIVLNGNAVALGSLEVNQLVLVDWEMRDEVKTAKKIEVTRPI